MRHRLPHQPVGRHRVRHRLQTVAQLAQQFGLAFAERHPAKMRGHAIRLQRADGAPLPDGAPVVQAVLEGVLKRLQGAAENLCVPLVERANGELAPVTSRQYQLSLKVSGAAAALSVH